MVPEVYQRVLCIVEGYNFLLEKGGRESIYCYLLTQLINRAHLGEYNQPYYRKVNQHNHPLLHSWDYSIQSCTEHTFGTNINIIAYCLTTTSYWLVFRDTMYTYVTEYFSELSLFQV